MRQGNLWQRFDYILMGASILLVLIGILMVRSATMGAVDPDLITRVPDQIRFALLGMVVVVALAALDYRLLSALHMWLYILMMVLLLMVFFFGVEGDGGSQSWLNLGIRIQPAEVARSLIIITLANHLALRFHKIDKITTIIASLVHVTLPMALIFIQPDLGMTVVFIVIWVSMIWAAGLTFKHIMIFVLLIAVGMPLIWSQMLPYQRQRITTFIDPDSDPDAFYNIDQATIAIGSGGLFGEGYANGTQSQGRFLRVRHTDFIFAVISEEFGFVGALTVMALLGLVIMRILRAARLAADPFGSMICYGVAATIFFQTFVSIGMNIALLPVTGLTLPFISSGGTSLLSILAGIGLVQSVVMRQKRL